MNIDMKALKGVIEEIEASKVRQKGEAEFQREAIKRAVKQHQLDGKAIRIVLQRRAMGDEKRDEQDYYVHAYEMALGGKKLAADALASGATIREAAAIGGISTGAAGNLAKVVQKSEKMDKPEDGDDGITESCGGVDSRRHVSSGESESHREGQQQRSAGFAPGPHDTSFAMSLMRTLQPEDKAPATPSVGAVAAEPRVAPPYESPTERLIARYTDDDMPDQPAFLRRGAA